MADGEVGFQISDWLISQYREDLGVIVTTSENKISSLATNAEISSIIFKSDDKVFEVSTAEKENFDLGFLLWWPRITKDPLLSMPKYGFINTHPSFLPYGRGKHYNFWTLVEEVPFGVSLHTVDEGVDTGDIIAQRKIDYDWEDNGGSLYSKAQLEMVELFKETYPKLRTLNFNRSNQDLKRGSFHKAKELDKASVINLDADYSARHLLNLLRARTFAGQPACYFTENGQDYEVRVEIKKKNNYESL